MSRSDFPVSNQQADSIQFQRRRAHFWRSSFRPPVMARFQRLSDLPSVPSARTAASARSHAEGASPAYRPDQARRQTQRIYSRRDHAEYAPSILTCPPNALVLVRPGRIRNIPTVPFLCTATPVHNLAAVNSFYFGRKSITGSNITINTDSTRSYSEFFKVCHQTECRFFL